jgi:hypothetical protein
MKRKQRLLCGAVAAILSCITACKDSEEDSTPAVTGVTVTAAADSAVKGGTLQFAASVAGTDNQTVTWSVITSGIAAGTSIDNTGLLTVAAGETKTSLEIQAAAAADRSKTGTKTIALINRTVPGSIEATFSGLPQDETTSFTGTVNTLSWRTGMFSIGVPAASFPGARYQWYLDGVPLDGAVNAALSKPGSDFTPGRHDVTVRITTADYQVYSKTIRFTVVE